MVLRSEGLLEDNKILTDDSRQALSDYAQWAKDRQDGQARKDKKK